MAENVDEIQIGVSVDDSAAQAGFSRIEKMFGELQASVNQHLASIESAFKDLSSQMDAVGSVMKNALGIGGLALTFAGLQSFVKGAAEEFAKLRKSIQESGVGIEVFQGMRYAAADVGVAADTVSSALGEMTKKYYKVKNDDEDTIKALKKNASDALDAIKVSSSPTEALDKIRNAFLDIEDPVDRIKFLMAVFGDKGKDMARVFVEHATPGLEAFTEAARKAGAVMNDEALKGAERLEAQYKKLSSAAETAAKSIAVSLGSAYYAVTDNASGMDDDYLRRSADRAKIVIAQTEAEIEALKARTAAASTPEALMAEKQRLESALSAGTSLQDNLYEQGKTMKGSAEEAYNLNLQYKELITKNHELADALDLVNKKLSGVNVNAKTGLDAYIPDSWMQWSRSLAPDFLLPGGDEQKLRDAEQRLANWKEKIKAYDEEMARRQRVEPIKAAETQAVAEGLDKVDKDKNKGAENAAVRRWEEYHAKLMDMEGQYEAAIQAQRDRSMKWLEEDHEKKLISEKLYQQAKLDIEEEADIKRRERMMKSFAPLTSAISNDLGRAFDTWIEKGEFSWKKLLATMIADIAKAEIRMQVLNPIFGGGEVKASQSLVSQGLSALFGGGSSQTPSSGSWDDVAASTSSATWDFSSAVQFHSGGLVGDGGEQRWISPRVFESAARWHDGGFPGLAAGEVPAILQRGELVLPRDLVGSITSGQAQPFAPAGAQNHVNIGPGAVVIQSPNPEAFRASSGQLAAELARMVSRGQRNL